MLRPLLLLLVVGASMRAEAQMRTSGAGFCYLEPSRRPIAEMSPASSREPGGDTLGRLLVRVRAFESDSGSVARVELRLRDSMWLPAAARGVTDSLVHVALLAARARDYRLQVTMIGRHAFRGDVTLRPGYTDTVDVVMVKGVPCPPADPAAPRLSTH